MAAKADCPPYPFWRLTNPDKTKESGITQTQMRVLISGLDWLQHEADAPSSEAYQHATILRNQLNWLLEGVPEVNDNDYEEDLF